MMQEYWFQSSLLGISPDPGSSSAVKEGPYMAAVKSKVHKINHQIPLSLHIVFYYKLCVVVAYILWYSRVIFSGHDYILLLWNHVIFHPNWRFLPCRLLKKLLDTVNVVFQTWATSRAGVDGWQGWCSITIKQLECCFRHSSVRATKWRWWPAQTLIPALCVCALPTLCPF